MNGPSQDGPVNFVKEESRPPSQFESQTRGNQSTRHTHAPPQSPCASSRTGQTLSHSKFGILRISDTPSTKGQHTPVPFDTTFNTHSKPQFSASGHGAGRGSHPHLSSHTRHICPGPVEGHPDDQTLDAALRAAAANSGLLKYRLLGSKGSFA